MTIPIAAILLSEPEITITLGVLKTAIRDQLPEGVPNALRSVLIKLESCLSDDTTY